jgi:hypothetical protein
MNLTASKYKGIRKPVSIKDTRSKSVIDVKPCKKILVDKRISSNVVKMDFSKQPEPNFDNPKAASSLS